MKDWVVILIVVFVLWYALRNGVFAQLGGGNSPAAPFMGYQGSFVNFETPWGNYAGGW